MILAINIGNTNLMLGFRQNGRITTVRYPCELFDSRSDFTQTVRQAVIEMGLRPESVTGAVLSSVNPRLTERAEKAAAGLFSVSPLTVSASMNMRLNLSRYDAPRLGGDRIAVCEGGFSKYGAPLTVFDFGTATTVNVVDGDGRFLGGAILPGLTTGIAALAKNTALLPHIELDTPTALIGRNTRECIVSGAVFGGAVLVDGMSARIEKLLGRETAVVITGGNAGYVAPVCDTEIIYDPDILAEGLLSLYRCNAV